MLVQKTILFSLSRLAFLVFMISCCGDPVTPPVDGEDDLSEIPYNPQSYKIEIPDYFPELESPADNEMTVDGVALGRRLFYDPILSSDGSMSCASCHKQENSFSDPSTTSQGVLGEFGTRNAMSLVNTGFFYEGLFWDGREPTLESQALVPVEDPIELHEMWPNVEKKLRDHDTYPTDFRKAFGISKSGQIDRTLVTKALAQFQRSIVSYDSKFDKVKRNEAFFTEQEFEGFDMFFDISPTLPDAECGHCHNEPLFTTNEYFNNGIQEVTDYYGFSDLGLGGVTNNKFDNGKFRVPSLRNIALTAPYMHDGRFQTLEEVLDHYNSGGHEFENVDPLVLKLGLTESQKSNLLAFLQTLTDSTVVTSSKFSDPSK